MGINYMRKFNLEAAKRGEPVCTVRGKKVRILSYDLKDPDGRTIAAAVTHDDGTESLHTYFPDGSRYKNGTVGVDLRMGIKKHKVWINLYKDESPYVHGQLYYSEEEAKQGATLSQGYYITTKCIEFEY